MEDVADVIRGFDTGRGVIDRFAVLDPFVWEREELTKTLAVQTDATVLHQNPVILQLVRLVFLVILADDLVLFLHTRLLSITEKGTSASPISPPNTPIFSLCSINTATPRSRLGFKPSVY